VANACQLRECIIYPDSWPKQTQTSIIIQEEFKILCKFPFKPYRATNYTIEIHSRTKRVTLKYRSPPTEKISLQPIMSFEILHPLSSIIRAFQCVYCVESYNNIFIFLYDLAFRNPPSIGQVGAYEVTLEINVSEKNLFPWKFSHLAKNIIVEMYKVCLLLFTVTIDLPHVSLCSHQIIKLTK
jgi:hypothetical protein